MFHAQERSCTLKSVALRKSDELRIKLKTRLNRDDQSLLALDPEHFASTVAKMELRANLGAHDLAITPKGGDSWCFEIRNRPLDAPKAIVERPKQKDGKGKGKGKAKGLDPKQPALFTPDERPIEARSVPDYPIDLEFHVDIPVIGKLEGAVYQGLHQAIGGSVDVEFHHCDRMLRDAMDLVVGEGITQLHLPTGNEGQVQIFSGPKNIGREMCSRRKPSETLHEVLVRLLVDSRPSEAA